MWKRYNAIEEKDLTQTAQKLNRYLENNTVLTPDRIKGQGHVDKSLKNKVPVAQLDRASAF